MQGFDLNLTNKIQATQIASMEYKPRFYRLYNEEDKENFAELLEKPAIKVSDELHSQLRELVKSLHPTKVFKSVELDEAAKQYLGETPAEEYGVWVYYPWLNHVVHLLDEDEYRNVRTNRNQFKITPEERDILATKTFGILGLSVGQSVAIALSMERGYGELRIGDFDVLELSNLNRIRSGVQDLGLLKTVSTARQIAEIDPFLNVKCFHEGLTEENMESFMLEGGKLDILIDECDGLDIKILARLKARELGIPVLMETSDRGMLDIERFDLEPERPILHGLIDHLDINPANLKGLTNEQKVPYVLPMVGIETMSERLKASMLEIEQSITTWPQLASDVILGGAVSANVCRRIALGGLNISGRFFVDINEIVKEGQDYQFEENEEIPEVLKEEMIDEDIQISHTEVETNQIDLSKEQVETLVGAAILAPSGGNSQPWKFVYKNRNLYLFLDESRATSFLDFKSAGSYLGLGAATENLILKAHQMGFEVNVHKFPEVKNKKLVAVFRFYNDTVQTKNPLEEKQFQNLYPGIEIRLTNRLLRDREKFDQSLLEKIKLTGESVDGAIVKLLEVDKQIDVIGELIAKVDRILITHKEGHHGFVNEIRWNDEEAEHTKDGVDLATIDLSAGEAAGFKMAKNWSVVKTLNTWGGGSVFEKLSKKCIAGASAVGLISMTGTDSENYFNAGRALERLWLQANLNQVALQPMTGLTFMLHRLIQGNGESLTQKNIEELTEIKQRFFNLFELSVNEHPVFLFRLLKAEDPKVKSFRRPVKNVISYT